MEGSTPAAPSGYSIFVRLAELDALGLGLAPSLGDEEVSIPDDLAFVARAPDVDSREKAVEAALSDAEKLKGQEGHGPATRRLIALSMAVAGGKRVVFQVAGARGLGEVPVQIDRKLRIG